MNMTLLAVLAVLNLPLFFYFGKMFFGSWDGLFESIVDIVRPQLYQALTADPNDPQPTKFTLFLYLIVCVSVWLAEYHVIAKFVMGIEKPWG